MFQTTFIHFDRFCYSSFELIDCMCFSCFHINLNPIICSNCKKLICFNCISLECLENFICPNCNDVVFFEEDRKLQKYVNCLPLYCKNNENGCKEIQKGLNILLHEENCRYGYISCPNEGCTIPNLIKLFYPIHQKTCDFKNIFCLECKKTFKRFENHFCKSENILAETSRYCTVNLQTKLKKLLNPPNFYIMAIKKMVNFIGTSQTRKIS